MSTQKRPPVKDRKLDSSALALNIRDEVQRLKREPEWISGKENGITLAKYPHMRVVLVALRKGTALRRYSVEGPLSLYVVSGRIHLETAGIPHDISAGQMLTLRRTVTHDVRAVKDSVYILTIMRL